MLAILAACALAAAPAQGAFPGQNGRIVFSGEGDLFTVNPDGTGQATLLAGPESDHEPAWSPDGTKVAFSRRLCNQFCGRPDIYVVNADGTGLRQLTAGEAFETQPAWSPDGRRIVFSRTAEDFSGRDIWVMGADGTRQTRLTNDPDSENGPAWSPDGSRIAFGATGGVIHLINADGTNETALTEGGSADWSPDGLKLVFSRSESDIFFIHGIYTINVDGTNETPLYDPRGQSDKRPVWSPQGDRIAFDREECALGSPGCLPADVHTVNPDGSGVTPITAANATSDIEPDWQPIPVRPRREDFKNGPAFCRAEREFLGDERFAAEYGTNGKGSNAFGKCVGAEA
jgi:Tol biopolymer transport system component